MAVVGKVVPQIHCVNSRSVECFQEEVNRVLREGVGIKLNGQDWKIESVNVTFVKFPEGGGYTLYQAVLSGKVFVKREA